MPNIKPPDKSNNAYRHGMRRTAEYKIWCKIKERCLNPKTLHFERWGGRGISICETWKNDFMAFYGDMGPRPSPVHSIDRKRNNEDYCKENCKWSTPIEQANNTRRNIVITFQGKTQSLPMWCQELDLDYRTTRARISVRKWSAERAFATSTKKPFTSKAKTYATHKCP